MDEKFTIQNFLTKQATLNTHLSQIEIGTSDETLFKNLLIEVKAANQKLISSEPNFDPEKNLLSDSEEEGEGESFIEELDVKLPAEYLKGLAMAKVQQNYEFKRKEARTPTINSNADISIPMEEEIQRNIDGSLRKVSNFGSPAGGKIGGSTQNFR